MKICLLYKFLLNTWRGNDKMKLGYSDEDIYRICNEKQYAYKKIGKQTANKLFRKLQSLSVTENLQEFYDAFSSWRPHPLKGDLLGYHAFDLDGQKRIIFHPADSAGDYCTSNTAYISISCIIIKEVSKHYGD